MKTTTIIPSNKILYEEDRRYKYSINTFNKLERSIGYFSERIEPEIELIEDGEIVQGQYMWGANCSHLFYDVLSDFIIAKEYGYTKIKHKPTLLSSQFLSLIGAELIDGNDAPAGEVMYGIKDGFTRIELNGYRFGGHKHSYLSKKIKQSLLPLVGEEYKYPSNIIIKRKPSPGREYNRNIYNSSEFISYAGNYCNYGKFQEIVLEDLKLEDQILVFKNAKNIISTHGSGLVWLNLCEPGTNVIEIITPWFRGANGYHKHDFWIIGYQNNLNFKSIYIDEIIGDSGNPYNHDVIIPNELIMNLFEIK